MSQAQKGSRGDGLGEVDSVGVMDTDGLPEGVVVADLVTVALTDEEGDAVDDTVAVTVTV